MHQQLLDIIWAWACQTLDEGGFFLPKQDKLYGMRHSPVTCSKCLDSGHYLLDVSVNLTNRCNLIDLLQRFQTAGFSVERLTTVNTLGIVRFIFSPQPQ